MGTIRILLEVQWEPISHSWVIWIDYDNLETENIVLIWITGNLENSGFVWNAETWFFLVERMILLLFIALLAHGYILFYTLLIFFFHSNCLSLGCGNSFSWLLCPGNNTPVMLFLGLSDHCLCFCLSTSLTFPHITWWGIICRFNSPRPEKIFKPDVFHFNI